MPSIVNCHATSDVARRNTRILLAASCLGLLALSDAASSRPAPADTRASTHAETSRAAQLRHARNVQNAARNKIRTAVRQPSANALGAHASIGVKRPPFGWPTLVTEARKYIGTNPTAMNKRWCARFLNLILNKTGYGGTNSDAARSFASYGRRISEPRLGAIAVLSRGKNRNFGHVGIVSGIDANGNPIIISGNHGHRVGEATYPRARVIAYVMPTDRAPGTQIAQAGGMPPLRMSDADHESGLSSPIAELLAAINGERATDLQRGRASLQAVRQPGSVNTQRAPDQAARPQPRPAAYRIVQQMSAHEPEPRLRVASAYHVSMATPSTPLPRPRASVPPAPMPRDRPQVD